MQQALVHAYKDQELIIIIIIVAAFKTVYYNGQEKSAEWIFFRFEAQSSDTGFCTAIGIVYCTLTFQCSVFVWAL